MYVATIFCDKLTTDTTTHTQLLVGLMVWNSVPTDFLDLSVGLSVFRRTLKTILFARYLSNLSTYLLVSLLSSVT